MTLDGGALGGCSLHKNHLGCCIVAEFDKSNKSQADLGATERALAPLLVEGSLGSDPSRCSEEFDGL